MENRTPLHELLSRYIDGDDSLFELLWEHLSIPVRNAVARTLPIHDPDHEDIVHDTFLALMSYLRRTGKTPANPEAYAATVARNRCINLLIWRQRRQAVDVDEVSEKLPHVGVSVLDLLDDTERREALQEALDALGDPCRELLQALYGEGLTVEQVRRDLNLGSVQGVYHRRNVCLQKIKKLLKRRDWNPLYE
jgi:RNA polymerase sigma factor (sigma-70 family)